VDEGAGATENAADQGLRHAFRRLHTRLHRNPITSLITKVVVTCVGVAVILAGLVMLVTPGPGIVGIAVGLGILALEYEWAERWVKAARKKAHEAAEKARQMDPKVRRRRTALTVLGFVVVLAGLVAYLRVYGWPQVAVRSWDWVQGISSAIPDLPGM
jgi:uncharacterized protein (TIGR02611 family)